MVKDFNQINIVLDSEALFPMVSRMVPECDTLLDIGPGIRPCDFIKAKLHICVEPYKEYIDFYTNKVIKGEADPKIYLNMSWQDSLDYFPDKSVDVITIIDVIEHLPKDEGMMLLLKTQEKCKKAIVIFTPLGFMPQCHPDGIDAWGLKGGEYQEHKSGWLPSDFSNHFVNLVCEDFHKKDHNGVYFDKPYGAFFAIRNMT
jgi:hypothetical protein